MIKVECDGCGKEVEKSLEVTRGDLRISIYFRDKLYNERHYCEECTLARLNLRNPDGPPPWSKKE